MILSGCNSDFLDKNPLDAISAPTFWKQKADFDNGLTACYGVFQEETFCLDKPIYDSFTDICYSWADFLQNQQEISKGQITPTTGGFINNIYYNAYVNIARQNIFLKQLDGYTGTDVTDAIRANYKAEVSFLRAWNYFQLWNYYGDVPLVLEPLTLATQNQPKATAAEVLAQILKDLDYTIANGSTKAYYLNNGHVGKAAGQALKARVLLYDASTNGAYHPGGIAPDATKLATIRDLCDDIIKSSGHSLSPTFENVFRQNTQASNPEIIFSTIFLQPNNWTWTDLFYADWYTCSPLPSFVADFECTDGLLPAVSPLYDPTQIYKNRDPRLRATVFNHKASITNKPIDWEYEGDFKHYYTPSNSNQGLYGGVNKFCTPDNVPFNWGSRSGQDWVHIRYAEVLLMFAEAQNELVGPVTAGAKSGLTAYDAINLIRTRSVYPGAALLPALPAGLTQAQMRDKVRHERKIELAFEGFRYFDLKRWGNAGDVINNIPDNLITSHWDNKFYKWPLPQGEIDKSNGVLVQNSDY